ncbi:MAG: hypothetical protein KatS3mg090_0313 [Patescibacteria group bacterium]|nr:MAG: hypothetical protein KatS3mg090_0313 [Patescibacteria group bacterium]
MRFKFILIPFILIISFTVVVLAQTDSAVTEDKKVEEIKQRISSQINSNIASAIDVESGFLSSVNQDSNKFELNYNNKKIFINYDSELLKVFDVSGSKTTEISVSDLNEKDYLVGLGNNIDNEFHVLNLYRQDFQNIASGTVMEVRKDDSAFLAIDELGNQTVVEIDRGTDLQIISEDKDEFSFQKAVFGKIKENDRVVYRFIASDSAHLDNISAEEVIIIPQELLEQLHVNK